MTWALSYVVVQDLGLGSSDLKAETFLLWGKCLGLSAREEQHDILKPYARPNLTSSRIVSSGMKCDI